MMVLPEVGQSILREKHWKVATSNKKKERKEALITIIKSCFNCYQNNICERNLPKYIFNTKKNKKKKKKVMIRAPSNRNCKLG